MQNTKQQPAFGKWRNRLWPFHRHELKKIFPLILIKFLVSLIYCILFCLKDAITITSKTSGAEAILVLKNIIVFPAAIIAALTYARLSNVLKKTTLFYLTIGGFMVALFAYAFILYPNEAYLSPTASADWITSIVGEQYSYWVSVYRNWIHSLLFVTAELWGATVILVVFWGFANDVSTVSEAKRSYTIYIAAGDLAMTISGPIVAWISTKLAYNHLLSVQCLIGISLVAGCLIIATYFYMQKRILKHVAVEQAPVILQNKTKEKVSFFDGIRRLFSSPYLLRIAILVIAYGLSMTLVEISWKAHLKNAFPSTTDCQKFLGDCQFYVGIIACVLSAFFGSSMIRRLGWRTTALLTPMIVGGAGLLFLTLTSSTTLSQNLAQLLGLSPLFLLVYIGAFHNIASKIAKHALFDPTKEMTYIPLSDEEKLKGKAAIDIVGSRLGKSGAANLQIILMSLGQTGSILAISHYLAPLLVLAVIGWIYSVFSLNKKFMAITQQEAPTIVIDEKPALT